MRLHCRQASRRPSMAIDRPPLLMAHIDPGIGPNISMCVRGVGDMCV